MTLYLIARLVCNLYQLPFPLVGCTAEGASYNTLLATMSALTMPVEIFGLAMLVTHIEWRRLWRRN